MGYIVKNYRQQFNRERREKHLAKQRECKRKQRLNPEYRKLQANKVKKHKGKYKGKYKGRYKLNKLKKFNITIDDYYYMLSEQNGCCKICLCRPNGNYSDLCLDHDHKTGQFRGLLCRNCNTGIGFLKDDTTIQAQLEIIKDEDGVNVIFRDMESEIVYAFVINTDEIKEMADFLKKLVEGQASKTSKTERFI